MRALTAKHLKEHHPALTNGFEGEELAIVVAKYRRSYGQRQSKLRANARKTAESDAAAAAAAAAAAGNKGTRGAPLAHAGDDAC